MKKTVGIVIVNYNGENYQNECIQSILDSSYSDYFIIIVDNNSKDNSMQMLKEFNDDRIVSIYEKENWGVAKGNNIGIKKSLELGCEYTLLLNNDTVLKKDTIQILFEQMSENKVAVPLILYNDTDLIWYGGGEFLKYKCTTKHINQKKEKCSVQYCDYYEYAPTCCMLINNEVFNTIGLMDEKYFMYFDDTDFCMRLKKNGIPIRFCKESEIYHKVSLSTGGDMSKVSIYYQNRNRFYFYNKYNDYYPKVSFLYFNITRLIKYCMGILKHNNSVYIRKAIKDYYAGKMGRCNDL